MRDLERRARDLTDIMARVLHYQDRGEPDWASMDYQATLREMGDVPHSVVERYRTDAIFHRKVQRAVALIMELDRKPSSAGDKP